MKTRLLWVFIWIIGIAFIGFSTIVICDVELYDTSIDVTNTAEYLQDDSQLHVNLVAPPQFKYLELKINADDIKMAICDFNGTIIIENKTVHAGRNFIEIPKGEYTGLQLWFEGGKQFKIAGIRFSEQIPLRNRHIALFVVFATLWCIVVNFLCRKSRITINHIQNLMRYSYLLSNLVKRDFTTKYRRSMLGVIWSVLNPFMMALVVSLVFSNFFKFSIEHFPIYYLTGSLIFTFTSEATSGALGAILGSGALIKKVYIPKYIFPIEKCLFAMVNALFSFVALFVIMPFFGIYPKFTVFLSIFALLYTLIFSIGLGMILSAVNVFFRDIGHLWSVWSVAWSFLTPIFYPVEILPDGVRVAIQYNPAYHFVEYFRQTVLYGVVPDMQLNITCLTFSVGALAIGLAVFKKTQDKFILYM